MVTAHRKLSPADLALTDGPTKQSTVLSLCRLDGQ